MTAKTAKKGGKTASRSASSGGNLTGKTRKPAAKSGRKRPPRKGFSKIWAVLLVFATGLTAITLVWALHLTPLEYLAPSLTPSGPSAPVASVPADHAQATSREPRQAAVQPSRASSTGSATSTRQPHPSPPTQPPDVVAHLAAPPLATNHVRARVEPQARPQAPSGQQGLVYEIFDQELLEQQVKEVDLALIQTIMELNLDPRSVRHLDIQMKTRNGQKYHTQSLSIGLNGHARDFERILRRNLELWVKNPELRLIRNHAGKQEWRISLLNLPTHTLFLEEHRPAKLPDPKPALPGAVPRLVVVIDDLGESLHQARELAALSFPVTFAVLPNITKTREVAQIGAAAGREVLLHQPMEPLDYPHRANPGPGALFVDMEEEQIREVLRNNLAQVPQAIGINNHMGSRFTADDQGMATVLDELRRGDLFFLDSMTTSSSVSDKQARKIGLNHLRRHIFLDNIPNVQAILFQLRKAEQLAHSQGQVIAIGHPYPETLEALKIWDTERDPRINVVSLGSLIHQPALAGR